MTRIAILDYGMGNLRSVEKALERVGAEAEITADRARVASRRRRDPARASAPSRRRWSGSASSASTSWSPSASRPGVPVLGICLGMQLLFDSSTENEGADGPRPARRDRSTPLEAERLKVPHIGWSPVRWEHDSRLTEGLGDGDALLLRPLLRARARPRTTTCSAPPPTASASPARSSATPSTASSSTRRSRAPPGCGLLANFAAHLRRLILYPAIDIRGGKAVRLIQGDYERETAYDADPVGRGPALGRRRRPLAARRRPRRRPGRASRSTSSTCGGSSPRSTCPVQLGGGLRDSKKVEEASRAGAERVVLGTAAVRDPELAEAIAAAHGDRVVVSVDARAGKVAAEGWTEAAGARRRRGGRRLARARRPPLRLHAGRGRRADGGPGRSTRCARSPRATDGEVIYSGGVGSLDDLRRSPALGLDEPRRRDRRPGALRAPLHGRRGAGGARR